MKAGAPGLVVVGAGAFGAAAAAELARRGHAVTLVDPGPLPHPAASSTDISKAVRMDYGSDVFYAELAERALAGWRSLNRSWGEVVFREVGILLLASRPLEAGGFEAASHDLLVARGVPLERLDRSTLGRRFSAWSEAAYVDGYFNPRAGWVASGRAVERLLADARLAGVTIREGSRVVGLREQGSRVTGVLLDDGAEIEAGAVIVAAGAWTPALLPELEPMMWATAQSVVHFAPADPRPFAGERFPVWCADIAKTGWYGFPVNDEGRLKIGHHGPGRRYRSGEPLAVPEAELPAFRAFAERTFPGLAGAPIVGTRCCLYCDTHDGDFLIDHHPDRPGLIVAAGGSGHGFKFAPLLGPIIADVFERRSNPDARRFAWRAPGARRAEQARNV